MRFFLAALFVTSIASADPVPLLQGRTIVLDPGHATLNYEGTVINPGKTSRGGTKERAVVMKISQKLGELLEKEGARVLYTRTPRDAWRESYNVVEDNKARADFANKIDADSFISIHCDWHPRSRVHGVTTFYVKDNSRKLGASIQKAMVKGLGARDRQLVRDSYTVLDVAEMPAVIVETGFLSHGTEAKKLSTESYQTKVATALFQGIRNYFGEIGVLTAP